MMVSSKEKLQELRNYFETRKEELDKGMPEKQGFTSEKKYIGQVLYILNVAEAIIRESLYDIKCEEINETECGDLNKTFEDIRINNNIKITIDKDILIVKNNDPFALLESVQDVQQAVGNRYTVIGLPSKTDIYKAKIDY